ncbi:hypothetical protein COY62_02430 [bacterium (Candidatus Howlettbacteria) CG_4_10_14_0_8_um_filter_40_9]|nr:MAG: hypothetical protein COY62_02430 [bacterium (Candidatus Howlettbacteria) CG_4_10_14_0_8_um_filter_40_9]
MQILSLILFYTFTVGGYFYFSRQPTDIHFLTSLDRYVPTIPIFIIPYLFATVTFIAIPIFLYIKLDFSKTKIYLLAQTIASLISYIIFYTFPTSVIRELINGDGVFDNALRWLHTADRASAAFPSGHVFQSIIIGYFLWKYFPKSKPYILIILPLIIVSTVFLKQHYIPDIFGGIAVAIIAIFISRNFIQVQL